MKKGVLFIFLFVLLSLNFISAAANLKLDNNLTVGNSTYIGNKLIVGNDTIIGKNLQVGQNISANRGFFSFLGNATSLISEGWFNQINVGNLNVSQGITAYGPAYVDGLLSVSGDTYSRGGIYRDIGGDMGINFDDLDIIFYNDGSPRMKIYRGGNISMLSRNFDTFIDNYSFFLDTNKSYIGINTNIPQNILNVIGDINATEGYKTGAFTGITGNYNTGNCWFGINGGIITSTNCTPL